MGYIDRLLRITSARMNAFLDSVEDPASVIPMLIAELDDKYRVTQQAEVKAQAAVSGAQRRVDEGAGKLLRLERGAALAVAQGHDNLAREALAAQVSLEAIHRKDLESLKLAEAARDDARAARLQMGRQLAELQERRKDLTARAGIAKTQKTVQRASDKDRESYGGSLLDQVARMEEKLEAAESGLDVRKKAAGKNLNLDERLRHLQQQSEVEQRLAQLRQGEGHS